MGSRLFCSLVRCHLRSASSVNISQKKAYSHLCQRIHLCEKHKFSASVLNVRFDSSLSSSPETSKESASLLTSPSPTLDKGSITIDVTEDLLPEPPLLPESVGQDELAEALQLPLNAAGEPTLQSLGLGGWSPSGLVQTWLEYMHADFGLPWWGAIAIGTVCVRLLVFPLVIKSQRNAANLNNNMPMMQALQMKMTKARQMGDQMQVMRYSQELMQFMKEKEINPVKSMMVPLAQLPIFVSFFFGLRRMANLPVDSMMTGGLFWFTDLTVCDPYYLLPVITSATLAVTIELGVDGAKAGTSPNSHLIKYVMRAMPVIIFPFVINFPAAILCYWVSTNFVSLIQVAILRIPAVRSYFKIPALVKHNPENLPVKDKGFVKGVKESWTNMKISRELQDREQYDEVRFQKAGIGPIVRTYKRDPTRHPEVDQTSATSDPSLAGAKDSTRVEAKDSPSVAKKLRPRRKNVRGEM